MKHRVLAISNHGVFIGGGEHSFLDLLCRLRARFQILGVVPERAHLFSRLVEEGIETRIIDLPALRPWYTHKMLSSLAAFRKLCAAYRPTLIYANGSRAAFYGGIIGRFMGIPVIWHCRIAAHDPYLDPFLSRLSTVIIANSLATAKRFKTSFSGKIRVVHNGIDLLRLAESTFSIPAFVGADWKIILVIARASSWKRHDLALDAFGSVAKILPEAHLLLIGAKDNREPEWWDHLQRTSSQSPFSDRIHWIGQIEDIRPWLKSASMLLLPSDNESFGRVLVEAMAAGVPVVGTRSGGVPEIINDGVDGLLVTPGNAREMSNAIVTLLSDTSLSQRLSEAGRNRAEAFSLGRHVDQMVQEFEKTLRSHKKRV